MRVPEDEGDTETEILIESVFEEDGEELSDTLPTPPIHTKRRKINQGKCGIPVI